MAQVIDFEHHYVPPGIMKEAGGSGSPSGSGAKKEFFQGVPLSPMQRTSAEDRMERLEERIRDMDEAGIDVSVLSSSAGWHASLNACTLLNEMMAEAAGKHSNRLVALAHVPAFEGESAAREVRRAVEELGLKGAAIPCFYEGHNLDSRALWPFYEAACSLDVPVLVHPSIAPSRYALVPEAEYDLHRALVREFDMMTAVARTVFGGVLQDFPGLKIVFCHFGGGIATLRERIQRWQVTFDPPGHFEEDFSKIYFAASGYEVSSIALQAALAGIGADRLVFGTDYPYDFQGRGPHMRAWVQQIRHLPLPTEEKEKILGRNAAGILKRLKR